MEFCSRVCVWLLAPAFSLLSATLSLLVFQLHVVHYNSDKYKSFIEARDKPDGLAVLAFFYDVRKTHFCSFFPSPLHQDANAPSDEWASVLPREVFVVEKILFLPFGNAL